MDTKEIEINRIEIKIGKTSLQLTPKELKKFKLVLDDFFEKEVLKEWGNRWIYPIYIEPHVYPSYPYYPYYQVTCTNSTLSLIPSKELSYVNE